MRAHRFRALLIAAVVGAAACSGDASVATTGRPSPLAPSTTVADADPARSTAVAPPPAPPPQAASSESPPPSDAPAATLPAGEDSAVEDVVDGDTIIVTGGTRVRLIGVDTPETKDPRQAVQCFGVEASSRTASLLAAGTPVRLVYDVEVFDRYGRTLAYVYRQDDGLFVNAALVADGYAQVATFPPNVAHVDELNDLARVAREEGRGLWSACGDEPAAAEPAPVVPARPVVTAPPAARGGGGGGACDPSYPDVCLPPSPPDLDCGDIAQRRFRVLPPDPHRFDGNGDGEGCEG